MPYLNDKLRDSIDDKISHLFNLKDKKIQSKKFDPAFTVVQNKLRYILHTATIMHGQMLEEVYLTVLKEELTDYEVWEEKEFCVSEDAFSVSSRQVSSNILNTSLPYGDCARINGKEKKNQVDVIVYHKPSKKICAYEIKRGGSPHDRQKKEKLVADIIATKILLKSYAENVKNLEIKEGEAFLISHLGTKLLPPQWMNLQINGNDVDSHFGKEISARVEDAESYWNTAFNQCFDSLVKK